MVRRSPTPDRPSFGRAAGARYKLASGAGGVGEGTRHHPHSMRSCELALRVVGAAPGRLRGGVSCLRVECPGLGALPRPTARPSGVRPGPATHWLWVRCAGVGTRHQPHSALLHAGFACYRGGTRARWGGGLSCLGVERPWLGAPRCPNARPCGVRPGPATHWLWRGDPSPT